MAMSQLGRSEFSRRTTEDPYAQLNRREKPEELKDFLKFAVEKQVRQLISRPLAFTYLLPNFGYSRIYLEFSRLITYIEKCQQPGKKELTPIIFPVFIHLCLLMLQNSAKDEEGYVNSGLFFNKFKKLFLNAKGYENVLKELRTLKTVADVKKHEYFSKFWKMKFMINASLGVLQKLRTYLEKEKLQCVIYILHFYLYFEDEDSFTFVVEEETKFEIAEHDSQNILTNVDIEEISPSVVLPIDIEYNLPYFSAAEFNEDESEIAIASHDSSQGFDSAQTSCIYIESLGDSPKNVKKIRLPGITAIKYVPGSSDNPLVAAYGNNVKLVNPKSGKDVFKYETAHAADIWSVDANKSFLLTASKDLRTFIWKLNDPIVVKEYLGHKSDVTVVKFHPSGLYFATGSTDTTIFLWDIDKMIPVRYFTDHCGKITSLAFSPDGNILASTDSVGVVKLWDLRKFLGIFEVPDVQTPGTTIVFNDVSTQFAFCDDMGHFRKWDFRFSNEIQNTEYDKCPVALKFNRRRQWKIAFKNL